MGCNCGKIAHVEASGTPAVSPLLDTSGASTPQQNSVPVVANSSYNIFDVIKDKLSGNLKYVEEAVRKQRENICSSCEFHVAGVCAKCGCVTEFKIRYAQSSCAIGKW